MTDEQKLQWLKEVLANGINVAQINLGDGIQNIQMNAYGQMQGVPRHEDEKAQASPSQEKPEQPLASSNIVFNPRLFTSEATTSTSAKPYSPSSSTMARKRLTTSTR